MNLLRVYLCISAALGSRLSTANWWERSPNYSNSNNFCNVNNSGSANNNNANNSNGVAPDFTIIRSHITSFGRITTFVKGEILPEESRKRDDQNGHSMPLHGRFLHGGEIRQSPFHVPRQSSLGAR